jgi:hypothetical protein
VFALYKFYFAYPNKIGSQQVGFFLNKKSFWFRV